MSIGNKRNLNGKIKEKNNVKKKIRL